MCGILGQITLDKSISQHLQISSLHHRGPDGNGEWNNSNYNIYLGHTRLAILDPTSAGQQPMTDASNRFTVVFNGEIYNHIQLRALLPKLSWRGTSDTETLIELYASKGIASLHMLKGMFAFAIHDALSDCILLVRDRLGIKPLWIQSNKKFLCFASEIRSLLFKEDNIILNKQALSEYIGFGRMPGDGNIFEGIFAVQPGSWIKLFPTGELRKENWWPNAEFPALTVPNRQDCIRRVRNHIITAIEEHLISDVGVGAFLSGGIDSSVVALVAGKALGKKLRTVTVGFPQITYDERSVARIVAKKAGSDHCELEIGEDKCLDYVKEAVLSLDLPSVDAINTFIVSKAVRDIGLKVALSGLGGDELFGGYPAFKNVPYLKWLNAFPPRMSQHLVNLLPVRVREKLDGLNKFTIADLTLARRRLTSVASLKKMNLENGIPVISKVPKGLDIMSEISWSEIQGYMIPMLLRDSDQMSMAVGLEIRVPFLDHRLVEEVLCLPQKYKSGYGIKPLLVDAFHAELPSDVYSRPKQGFALPMDDWMRGPLFDFTNQGVSIAADLLNIPEPLNQQKRFYKRKLHWTRLWSWCVLGHWLKTNNITIRDITITS